MLSGILRSTWRRVRFQHCTPLAAVQEQKQAALDKVIRPVVREARRAPSVHLPAAASPKASRKPPGVAGDVAPDPSGVDAAVCPAVLGPAYMHASVSGEPPAPQQQQAAPMPSRKIRPSRMEFEAMYQQLSDWKQQYLTAHVPGYCFDAPELGAWVRKMRKQYKDGELEQWKVERLNQLQFEWEITDQDARWHHLYHQLRQYQLLHGSTDVDIKHIEEDGCDWSQVAWWLKKQARLLAKQKLSSHYRNMLAQLGVTLRIPKRIVTRTAALQALNGPERRKLRKKWKQMDLEAAEAVREQQQQEFEQQQEQQRRQEEVASRRLMLLRGAAGGHQHNQIDIDQISIDQIDLSLVGSGYGVQADRGSSSSSSSGVAQLLQQQYLAEMGLLKQQKQHKRAWGTEGSVAGQSSSSSCGSVMQGVSDIAGASGGPAPAAASDDEHIPHAADAQQQQHRQQQQQQPGLLYQRNRRYKRVSRSTKQERWMSAEQ